MQDALRSPYPVDAFYLSSKQAVHSPEGSFQQVAGSEKGMLTLSVNSTVATTDLSSSVTLISLISPHF